MSETSLFANFVMCHCGRVLVEIGTARDYQNMIHSANHCVSVLPTNHKENQMDFTTYVRRPFKVQAVEITADNIKEIARYVGDFRVKEDGTPYILVDRRLVPGVFRVYVGFYMTKIGDNVRCYSRKLFREQFLPQDENTEAWLQYLNGNHTPQDTPFGAEVPT